LSKKLSIENSQPITMQLNNIKTPRHSQIILLVKSNIKVENMPCKNCNIILEASIKKNYLILLVVNSCVTFGCRLTRIVLSIVLNSIAQFRTLTDTHSTSVNVYIIIYISIYILHKTKNDQLSKRRNLEDSETPTSMLQDKNAQPLPVMTEIITGKQSDALDVPYRQLLNFQYFSTMFVSL